MNEVIVTIYRMLAVICIGAALGLVTSYATIQFRYRKRQSRHIEISEAIGDVQTFRAWAMARSLLPKSVWMCLTESEFEKFREYALSYWSVPGQPITETQLIVWAENFIGRKRKVWCQ